MQWHPYAKLFPMLSDDELAALAEGSLTASQRAMIAARFPVVSEVYVCYSPVAGGVAKIGLSANVDRRVAQLQTACPGPLSLAHRFRGGRLDEAELHCRFANVRVYGEWFRYAGPVEEWLRSTSLSGGVA